VTIASRRRVYRGLFFAACILFCVGLFASVPFLEGKIDMSLLKRSGSYFSEKLFGLKFDSPGAATWSALFSGLYSVLCLGYILFSFRKTVSSEIFFFSFWALAPAFENLRPLAFSLAAGGAPISLVFFLTRVILAGRTMGLLSFFCASLYASGFHNEKLGSAAGLAAIISLALAASLPLNTAVFETSMILRPGFYPSIKLLVALAGIAIVADFVYASFQAGEAPYRVVALGSAAVLAGQALVLSQWRPLLLVPGFILLYLGSWFIVSRLHAYYLWQ